MTPTELLAGGVPLIDVRAPVEYAQGAFPGAANLPLLTDTERHEVGLTYRNDGRDAALSRGHELVSGTVRAERTRAWAEFAGDRPGCWLYCARGGLRSRIAQSWLQETGVAVPRVAGGFKSLRRACLDTLERAAGDARHWLVLAGRTGSGKTRVIGTLTDAIDLEALARHRGSAFGARSGGQPTPIDFENALAVAYLKHDAPRLVLEDESRTIGRLALPPAWFERMGAAPLVLLEVTIEERIANIRGEYVEAPLAGGMPSEQLQARLVESLDRIRKRLGGDRHRNIRAALDRGFRDGDHDAWIRLLLDWYYDPMYDYQLRGKRNRIVFRGGTAAVREYLGDY